MPQEIQSKTGNAELKKVGHTHSNVFGSEPDAKVRGRAEEPTPQTFGGSSR